MSGGGKSAWIFRLQAEPPTSLGLVATRGLIIDSGMPCVNSSGTFYRLHNPVGCIHILCNIAITGTTTMIRERMESDQMFTRPCFSEPD